MSEELDILKEVAEKLNGTSNPYMISGSVVTKIDFIVQKGGEFDVARFDRCKQIGLGDVFDMVKK